MGRAFKNGERVVVKKNGYRGIISRYLSVITRDGALLHCYAVAIHVGAIEIYECDALEKIEEFKVGEKVLVEGVVERALDPDGDYVVSFKTDHGNREGYAYLNPRYIRKI